MSPPLERGRGFVFAAIASITEMTLPWLSHENILYLCLPLVGSLWEPSHHAVKKPKECSVRPMCSGGGALSSQTSASHLGRSASHLGWSASHLGRSRGVACPPGSMHNVDAYATEMVIIVLGADFWGGLLHTKRSLIDTGGEGACH